MVRMRSKFNVLYCMMFSAVMAVFLILLQVRVVKSERVSFASQPFVARREFPSFTDMWLELYKNATMVYGIMPGVHRA